MQDLDALIGRKVMGLLTMEDDTEMPEYGVIVHAWWDDEFQAIDCYVAFFGLEVPVGKPAEKPYVLRYFLSSLTFVDG